ncbi:hypothetical protein CVCC1112_1974 [Paenarthrobacter nicotinovorans]|nr:hypothetical protein CVCC1112_1974 [Paenarthrobacter nicotinovorans]
MSGEAEAAVVITVLVGTAATAVPAPVMSSAVAAAVMRVVPFLYMWIPIPSSLFVG